MDPNTPDACMTNTWDQMGSLGKRERNDESSEEKSSTAPGTNGGCASIKKPALEIVTGSNFLGKLNEGEPDFQADTGEPYKIKKVTGASAMQPAQPAAGAVALLRGSTEIQSEIEQMQDPLAGLTEEQMIEFGYDHDTMQEFRACVAAAPKEKPVLVLNQLGKFNFDVFSEELHMEMAKVLTANMENETVKVGIYQQININDRKQTVLTVECSERVYNHYYGMTFDYKDKEALFKFEGTSLKEWITKVGTMEYLGTTYGLNIGPMPRAPTDDTIKMLAPLLKKYGKMTHVIYYADRTITIGFALGELIMPPFRKPIPLFDGGTYAGKLDATNNIRLMGVPCCSFCPGIGDYHSGECATNKEKQEAFLARKKKLAEKNTGTTPKPTKPTRRGKHGGLREIERKILKENMN